MANFKNKDLERHGEDFKTAFRPRRFDQMYGPSKKLAAKFAQQIANGGPSNYVHAIIGPSATGKTTLARLIAASLNCDNPQVSNIKGLETVEYKLKEIDDPDKFDKNKIFTHEGQDYLSPFPIEERKGIYKKGDEIVIKRKETKKLKIEPCGKCDNCKRIIYQGFRNITYFFEYYNVSNSGIEDLREIAAQSLRKSKHGFAKNYNKKIVVFEEAHTLTPKSIELLKPYLEDLKGKDVYVIFLTTKEEQLFQTDKDNAFRSRLSIYELRKWKIEEIVEVLKRIYINLNDVPEIKDDSIFEYIAENSKRNIRIALGYLQALSEINEDNIELELVKDTIQIEKKKSKIAKEAKFIGDEVFKGNYHNIIKGIPVNSKNKIDIWVNAITDVFLNKINDDTDFKEKERELYVQMLDRFLKSFSEYSSKYIDKDKALRTALLMAAQINSENTNE